MEETHNCVSSWNKLHVSIKILETNLRKRYLFEFRWI